MRVPLAGYYVRVTTVWRYTLSFLQQAGPEAQIVNLGAGFDTLYFRLKVSRVCDGVCV